MVVVVVGEEEGGGVAVCCVVLRVLCVCGVECVVCVLRVWCGMWWSWCGLSRRKNPPCLCSARLRVYIQNVSMEICHCGMKGMSTIKNELQLRRIRSFLQSGPASVN